MVDRPRTQHEYDERIEYLADAVEEGLAVDPDRHIGDEIHEVVDASRLVTHHPTAPLQFMQNEPREFHPLIPDEGPFSQLLRALAHTVVRTDVRVEVHERRDE